MSAKNIVFVAGQNGIEPKTGRTLQSIESQTRQCLENIITAIKPTGYGKEAIALCRIYLTDLKDENVVNEIYHEFFAGSQAPPKTIIGVAGLPKVNDSDILVTIEAVAIEA